MHPVPDAPGMPTWTELVALMLTDRLWVEVDDRSLTGRTVVVVNDAGEEFTCHSDQELAGALGYQGAGGWWAAPVAEELGATTVLVHALERTLPVRGG